MNALIILNKFNYINYKEKINTIITRLVPQDISEDLEHKIGLILIMKLLEINKLNIIDIMRSFRYNKNKSPSGLIKFSNSYSEGCIISAISTECIGVDIEKNNKYELDIFNDKEDKKKSILLLTLKESLGKYLNVGLNYNYKKINLDSNNLYFKRYGCYFKSYFYEEYIISCCSNFDYIDIIKITEAEVKQFIDKLLNMVDII